MGRGESVSGSVQVKRRGSSSIKHAATSPSALSKVQITEATTEDIPSLMNLKAQVVERAYGEIYPEDLIKEWIKNNATQKHFSYRIGRSGYKVFVARDEEGKPVGVGTMRRRGDRADMSGLYVLTPGKGIGTQIAEERERYARSVGCMRTRVSVFRTNEKARGFVTSRGFERTGGGFKEPTFQVRVDHFERDL